MKSRGFTLIELLIVVAIIGIIAAIAIPNLLISLQKSKQKATMADMTSIGAAIESYLVDWSFAPAPGATIITDLDQNWFRPFYIKVLPLKDGWGMTFLYDSGIGEDHDFYSIVSYGRNRIDDNTPVGEYLVTNIAHFNNEIIYCNGRFTVSPLVKR